MFVAVTITFFEKTEVMEDRSISLVLYALVIVLFSYVLYVLFQYCGSPLKAGLYVNRSCRPFLENYSVTRISVSLSR
jgi:hypothetical protein